MSENSKMLTSDLVVAISGLLNLPKNGCEEFVRMFFDAIVAALSIDGLAKVKGLGTFKLVKVSERKSVNVQTGEEIMIPEHMKVTFTPDKLLKEQINKPYSHLQTYILRNSGPVDPPEPEDEEEIVEDVSPVSGVAVSQKEVSEGAEPSYATQENIIDGSVTENKVEDVKPIESVVAVNTSIKHSESEDWSDSWGLEYESHTPVIETDGNMNSDSVIINNPVNLEQSVSVDSEDRGEEENKVEGTEENAVDSGSEYSTEVAAIMTDETGKEVEICDDETEAGIEENTLADVSSERVEADFEETADNSFEERAEEIETTGDNVAAEKDETAIENQEDGNATEETVLKPTVEDPFKKKHKKEKNDSEPVEEVHHGKVIGVCIVAFLVLLCVGTYSLWRIDPDFFKSLRVNNDDIPPVMPTDTTSLSQEMAIYAEQDSLAEAEAVKQAQEEVQNTGTEVIDEVNYAPVAKSLLNDNWAPEFLSYMHANYPNVNVNVERESGVQVMVQGLTLTQVALKEYGSKDYWVYLYLYNTSNIANPNNVRQGTKVKIPALDKSLANGENESTLDLAHEIRRVFVK